MNELLINSFLHFKGTITFSHLILKNKSLTRDNQALKKS